MRSHYELLQVFPRATAEEIKEAFRFLLFRYHPDHNRGREEWAVERTMELVEAYHTLSDPQRRAHYDVMRGLKVRAEEAKKGFTLFGQGGTKARQVSSIFAEGVEKYRADEYEAAIKSFRQVLALDPQYPNVRFNLALAFVGIERYPEAMQWLQEHVSRNKGDADARSLYSKISALASKKKTGGAS